MMRDSSMTILQTTFTRSLQVRAIIWLVYIYIYYNIIYMWLPAAHWRLSPAVWLRVTARLRRARRDD